MSSEFLLETLIPGVLRLPGYGVSSNDVGPFGYVIFEKDSAVLLDPPFFSDELAKEIQKRAPNGLTHIFLTHDDFGRMSRYTHWKRAFNGQPKSVVHNQELTGLDVVLEGAGPWEIDNFEVYHTPGHSAGSLFYMHRGLSAVFTGASFADFDGPTGFPTENRYLRSSQAVSLRSFAKKVDFTHHILPSYGHPMSFEDQTERLEAFGYAAADLDGSKSTPDPSSDFSWTKFLNSNFEGQSGIFGVL